MTIQSAVTMEVLNQVPQVNKGAIAAWVCWINLADADADDTWALEDEELDGGGENEAVIASAKEVDKTWWYLLVLPGRLRKE